MGGVRGRVEVGRERSAASVIDLCREINTAISRNREEGVNEIRKTRALVAAKKLVTGVPPSGPRKQGEGCEDDDQGIVEASEAASGGAMLRVTLLAAGFVIGP